MPKFTLGSIISQASNKKQDSVVLKVFDSSFFPRTDDPDPTVPDLFTPEPITDEIMAWAEVHAYEKLSSVQGRLIPHLVDAIMVTSPGSNQEKMAIVMSRIYGTRMDDICRELGSEFDGEDGETVWYPIALEFLRSIYEIHQLGIIGLTFNDPNFLVVYDPRSGQSRPFVKLLNFAFSRHKSFGTDTPEVAKIYLVDFLTKCDFIRAIGVIQNFCGGGYRLNYLRDRRLSLDYGGRTRQFMHWAQREYPEDPWIAAWWDKYSTYWKMGAE